MRSEPAPPSLPVRQQPGLNTVPAIFADASERATDRVIEFFTANIRNPNTRVAYGRAVRQFSSWCEKHELTLKQLSPVHIATFVEDQCRTHSKPTVKQHLAAIRMLFDYLVVGQVLPSNPAAPVRGPKYVTRKGKTPVLTAEETRQLLDAIDHRWDEQGRFVRIPDRELPIVALRDRALIAVLVFSFGRISAVLGMNVGDYQQLGKRCSLRLHEKGGKDHEVPAHHKLQEYLDAYLIAGDISGAQDTPLFRTIDRKGRLTLRRLQPRKALSMVKRRSRRAALGDRTCNHTFRATGITTYLENGGTLEVAQQIAAHESPRTTKLYDRTSDQLTLDEIEKIQI